MPRLEGPSSSSQGEAEDSSDDQHSPQDVGSSTTISPSTSHNTSAEKRKTAQFGMSESSSSAAAAEASSKRRRLGLPSQAIFQRELEARKDKEYYDPDQDPEERRIVRKGMRNLAKELNDSRAEFLQANSTGLYDTLEEADKYFKAVKQTSDATIDSRLLVTTADLSYKKTTQLALGDASTGIDVDDFVSRCIAYMRRGPVDDEEDNSIAPRSTQRPPRRQTQRNAGSDDEDDNEDGAFNWSYLGSTACFPYNSRPSLTGFLLGPLSLQKRARVQSQRRARQPRANLADAARPTQLTSEDLEGTNETANLTKICKGISQLLIKVQAQGRAKVEAEAEADMTDEEVYQIMQHNGISDDEGVPLMQFCVNPKSFGQTVENLFYVSFLIKEGAAGLNFDSKGLPTLHPYRPTPPEEAQAKGISKNQAVFAIDFETWEDLIRTFGVTESIIPHREEEDYDDGTVGRERNGDSREATWF